MTRGRRGKQDGGKVKNGETDPKLDTNSDTHTCKVCEKVFCDDNDAMLVCERCDNFVCVRCTDITDSEYKVLQTSAHLHWYCEHCETLALTAVKEDRQIEEKCSALFAEFRTKLEEAFSTQIQDIKAELSTLKKSMTQAKSQEADSIKSVVREEKKEDSAKLLSEMAERDRRRANLVWFGVPGSSSDDAQTRKTEDTSFVKKACSQALGVEVDIVSCKRLHAQGKQGSEGKDKRPMLVTLKDGSQVDTVLKEARKLKDNDAFKGVFIKKDCTPLERAEMKALVEERNLKREETRVRMGTEKWVIRNGRVVDVTRRNQQVEAEAAEGVEAGKLVEDRGKGRE